MRLFIAIDFNDAVRSKLTALRDELCSRSKRGRFTRSGNIHLTLAFLGECDDLRTEAAKAAMDRTVFEPFKMTMDRIGRFRRDGGDIWWAGVRMDDGLLELHNDLTASLSSAGLETDGRTYEAHVTLGREVRTDERPRNIEEFGQTVERIELMSSERIGGELTYVRIHERRAQP